LISVGAEWAQDLLAAFRILPRLADAAHPVRGELGRRLLQGLAGPIGDHTVVPRSSSRLVVAEPMPLASPVMTVI